MTEVALLGAGGNMGRRITRTLRDNPQYKLRLVEPGERGRSLIEEAGLRVVDQAEGLAGADVVVFAVPDKIVRGVAAEVVPLLDTGTSVLFLDPAAVAADRVPGARRHPVLRDPPDPSAAVQPAGRDGSGGPPRLLGWRSGHPGDRLRGGLG